MDSKTTVDKAVQMHNSNSIYGNYKRTKRDVMYLKVSRKTGVVRTLDGKYLGKILDGEFVYRKTKIKG